MNGAELKKRIDDLGISYAKITRELGVKPSAITGYFSTDKIRHSTLRRIDNAVRILTGGKHGLYDSPTEQEPSAQSTPPDAAASRTPASATVPDAAASGDPAPFPDQQQALDYAARQVATMSRRLSDSLARLEAREDELDKKEARMDALMERLEHRLSVISRYITANIPGAEPFIGNIDMAAEDTPQAVTDDAPATNQEEKALLYLDPLPTKENK